PFLCPKNLGAPHGSRCVHISLPCRLNASGGCSPNTPSQAEVPAVDTLPVSSWDFARRRLPKGQTETRPAAALRCADPLPGILSGTVSCRSRLASSRQDWLSIPIECPLCLSGEAQTLLRTRCPGR